MLPIAFVEPLAPWLYVELPRCFLLVKIKSHIEMVSVVPKMNQPNEIGLHHIALYKFDDEKLSFIVL